MATGSGRNIRRRGKDELGFTPHAEEALLELEVYGVNGVHPELLLQRV